MHSRVVRLAVVAVAGVTLAALSVPAQATTSTAPTLTSDQAYVGGLASRLAADPNTLALGRQLLALSVGDPQLKADMIELVAHHSPVVVGTTAKDVASQLLQVAAVGDPNPQLLRNVTAPTATALRTMWASASMTQLRAQYEQLAGDPNFVAAFARLNQGGFATAPAGILGNLASAVVTLAAGVVIGAACIPEPAVVITCPTAIAVGGTAAGISVAGATAVDQIQNHTTRSFAITSLVNCMGYPAGGQESCTFSGTAVDQTEYIQDVTGYIEYVGAPVSYTAMSGQYTHSVQQTSSTPNQFNVVFGDAVPANQSPCSATIHVHETVHWFDGINSDADAVFRNPVNNVLYCHR